MEKQWQTEARELYFEKGLQAGEIATRLGYSIESIRKFLQRERKARGVSANEPRARNVRSFEDRKVMSNRHSAIGARLSRYRFQRPGDEMTAEELGLKIGVSRLRAREMELGFHDFTLSELEKISAALECSLEELIQCRKI